MKEELLKSIREKTLKGLELIKSSDEDCKTKLILEAIAMSYAEILIPNLKEDNEEDKSVRFLVDEMNYYKNNI